MEKPKKENYGWQDGGIEEDTGWLIEGGEEAYYEALKEYELITNNKKENNE
jgi:hypothetical protein